MLWIAEKLQERLQELSSFRYKDVVPLSEWQMMLGDEKGNGIQVPPMLQGEQVIRKGDYWRGYDEYVWLRRTVQVPEQWKGQTVLGLFDFGRTGEGNNSGFESLLYLDGHPYQGVDTNHEEVFLPEDCAGKRLELVFRLWSGLEGGGQPKEQEHKFNRAELAILHRGADDLYFTGIAALETSKLQGDNTPIKHDLLTALDRAFLLVDWSCPGSDSFYTSVDQASRVLAEELAKLEQSHPVTIHCIGHTHIDVAWLWRLTHTREKAARSFSTVLRLMEQFPEYIFLQAQPQLYEYLKQDYPIIYEQIRERVKEQRWEAGGAMWLEADCNLISGESLVRQILYGTQFFREEFGVECEYLWLPDVFGYSWALPQILLKSGIKTFMTTKISWNQYNRMPHDTFKWRGIDGSEILTHFISTPHASVKEEWFYTYNGEIEPFSVQGIWDQYRDKEFNKDLLLSYGYGDGGGGVNRRMLEMRRRLDKMPGMPKVITGRADDYFEKLHETVDRTDRYVHVWDGELYLEYHRGTYTSQAYNKLMNRKLELLYRETEWLQALAASTSGTWLNYPAEKLHEGWITILRNQFHDIIPGSSIHSVYEDARIEYAEAETIASEVRLSATELLARHSDGCTFTVYNNASYDRTELVAIALEDASLTSGAWYSLEHKRLQAEYVDGKWLVLAEAVPAMGATELRFAADELAASNPAFSWDGSTLDTPCFSIHLNEYGQLTRIFDKEALREVLPANARANVLQVFEDKPMRNEAWDIDIYYQEKMKEIRDLQSIELIELGALRAVLRLQWQYGGSTIVQQLIVYASSRRIDFVTHIDWNEHRQLLKTAFPVEVRATEAVYDIQFGNVKRPTHWNTSWDQARFETVGHQWVDLSERNYGVSLLNDCKYGHDIKDNVIRLSLIKSAIYPDPEADQGAHQFTYSLYPHQGDWVQARTAQQAWALNSPLLVTEGASLFAGKSMFRVDLDGIMIDAVKKAECSDELVVRLHEYTGYRGPARLQSDCRIVAWRECDLMERPLGPDIQSSSEIAFNIAPYEIKTFLVSMESSHPSAASND